MKILGIETSCDETGIALVEAKGGFEKPRFRIVKNLVASQIKIHAPYGGVVPNLAKREHERNLPILLKRILNSRFKIQDSVTAIAVTTGPGLEPCLWEGINFAQALAEEHKKPVVAVNHMFGHITSVLLRQNGENSKSEIRNTRQTRNSKLKTTKDSEIRNSRLEFPAVALLVSGGHTELVLLKNWLDHKIIGETLDDAVGEAFDKVARLLGLPYPGGPALSALAERKITNSKSKIKLPRPMLNSGDLNFSFSGLKTAVLYALRDNPKLNKAALAREFQNAAVEVLVTKTIKAAKKHKPKTIILAGGVAANKELRKQLKQSIKKHIPYSPEQKSKIFNGAGRFRVPDSNFTGDNAAMMAAAGYFHALKKDFTSPDKLIARGNLSLERKKR